MRTFLASFLSTSTVAISFGVRSTESSPASNGHECFELSSDYTAVKCKKTFPSTCECTLVSDSKATIYHVAAGAIKYDQDKFTEAQVELQKRLWCHTKKRFEDSTQIPFWVWPSSKGCRFVNGLVSDQHGNPDEFVILHENLPIRNGQVDEQALKAQFPSLSQSALRGSPSVLL